MQKSLNLFKKHWVAFSLVGFKVLHLFKKFDLELFQHILILDSMVLYLGDEVTALLLEDVLVDLCKCTIVVASYCCSSLAVEKNCQFSEEGTLLQSWFNIDFLSHVIQNTDLTLAFCNEVEVIWLLIDPNNDIIWSLHERCDTRDDLVDNFHFILENRVLLKRADKDIVHYFLSQ